MANKKKETVVTSTVVTSDVKDDKNVMPEEEIIIDDFGSSDNILFVGNAEDIVTSIDDVGDNDNNLVYNDILKDLKFSIEQDDSEWYSLILDKLKMLNNNILIDLKLSDTLQQLINNSPNKTCIYAAKTLPSLEKRNHLILAAIVAFIKFEKFSQTCLKYYYEILDVLRKDASLLDDINVLDDMIYISSRFDDVVNNNRFIIIKERRN